MSTGVIQKYVSENILNYVEHETPRHYFLYDDAIYDDPRLVERLVEDLCDENMKMQRRIKELENRLLLVK